MIVGFNVDSLNAEKKKGVPKGNLQVNYSPEIKSVEEANVRSMDETVLRVNFGFAVNYNVGDETGASIEMDGNVLWNGDTEEILEHWEENESLPEDVHVPLMNDLYRKCISQSVGVADTLGLLPRFRHRESTSRGLFYPVNLSFLNIFTLFCLENV